MPWTADQEDFRTIFFPSGAQQRGEGYWLNVENRAGSIIPIEAKYNRSRSVLGVGPEYQPKDDNKYYEMKGPGID